jgi:hypothetical protein
VGLLFSESYDKRFIQMSGGTKLIPLPYPSYLEEGIRYFDMAIRKKDVNEAYDMAKLLLSGVVALGNKKLRNDPHDLTLKPKPSDLEGISGNRYRNKEAFDMAKKKVFYREYDYLLEWKQMLFENLAKSGMLVLAQYPSVSVSVEGEISKEQQKAASLGGDF